MTSRSRSTPCACSASCTTRWNPATRSCTGDTLHDSRSPRSKSPSRTPVPSVSSSTRSPRPDDEPGLLGDRDELARVDDAELRVRPPGQGLGAGDDAAPQVDDRLVQHRDVARVDRRAQPLLDPQPPLPQPRDAGVVDLDPVAARGLRRPAAPRRTPTAPRAGRRRARRPHRRPRRHPGRQPPSPRPPCPLPARRRRPTMPSGTSGRRRARASGAPTPACRRRSRRRRRRSPTPPPARRPRRPRPSAGRRSRCAPPPRPRPPARRAAGRRTRRRRSGSPAPRPARTRRGGARRRPAACPRCRGRAGR